MGSCLLKLVLRTTGTPVNFMINVDPNLVNDPGQTTILSGAGGTILGTTTEYTVRAEEVMIQAMKPAGHGTQQNTGQVYIVRKGTSGNTGNRDDTGSIIATLFPGQTMFLSASAMNRNVWNPYRYSVDADNPNDGVFVTLVIQ